MTAPYLPRKLEPLTPAGSDALDAFPLNPQGRLARNASKLAPDERDVAAADFHRSIKEGIRLRAISKGLAKP